MTRERGILFSGPMVRAILAGKKTQTRRVVNPQPAALCRFEMNASPVGPKYTDHRLACPYGVPGDRLWVRETWQALRQVCEPPFGWVVERDPNLASRIEYAAMSDFAGPWRPSIFMPRTLSRITLQVVEVRAQRLHDISEDDARAEGLALEPAILDGHAVGCFSRLWDSINGKPETMLDDDGEPVLDADDRPIKIAPKAWATNPWVWAITFRRLP